MPVVLGYWRIRGYAQPARLMLKYAGVDFEDKRYVHKEDPIFDPSKYQDWFDVKFKMGLDFPNVPYYIDGNVKLSQSTAIYRYIARKHNLYGSTEEDRGVIDMISEEIKDITLAVFDVVYYAADQEDYEKKKIEYTEKLSKRLQRFETFLGDKKWLIGDQLTYADFHWYDMMDQHIVWLPGCLKNFPKLQSYQKRFEKIPAIQAYLASDEFLKSPINDYAAYFIG